MKLNGKFFDKHCGAGNFLLGESLVKSSPELCVTATSEEVHEERRVDLSVMHAMQAVVRVVEHQRRRGDGRHRLGLVDLGLVKFLAAGFGSTLSFFGRRTEDRLENLDNGKKG